MKRIIALLMTLVLMLGAAAGCSKEVRYEKKMEIKAQEYLAEKYPEETFEYLEMIEEGVFEYRAMSIPDKRVRLYWIYDEAVGFEHYVDNYQGVLYSDEMRRYFQDMIETIATRDSLCYVEGDHGIPNNMMVVPFEVYISDWFSNIALTIVVPLEDSDIDREAWEQRLNDGLAADPSEIRYLTVYFVDDGSAYSQVRSHNMEPDELAGRFPCMTAEFGNERELHNIEWT